MSFKFAGMTIREANKSLLFQLYHIYDNREAAAICDLVMEKITGWKRIDRLSNEKVVLSAPMETVLARYTEELLAWRPVQYVLGESWFCGLKFYVDEAVLIPRPETEELVMWVQKELWGKELSILDIGTGSGCIAITLKKLLPLARIYASDISDDALEVARKNALAHDAEIHFLKNDVLASANELPRADIIVSNPPYIPESDREGMEKNVLAYEPGGALFVTNGDPLQFYRAIAGLDAAACYFEVHAGYAGEVLRLFRNGEVRTDMQGKQRFVKGVR